ncbi:MAG: PKD domain-containing protein [Bacteroidota bacterium]|nr:PKD domain-containing protein [Bacteroidota bacterium]
MSSTKRFILLIYLCSAAGCIFAQPSGPVFPKNNVNVADSIINFEWNKKQDAVLYDFQIYEDILLNTIYIDQIGLTYTNITISGFNYNQDYFWRVRYYNGTSYSAWSPLLKFTVFNPSASNGLCMWLAADSGVVLNGNKVSQWNDISGNNLNAQQVTNSIQPEINLNSTGDKPAIKFSGSEYLLINSGTQIGTAFAFSKWGNSNVVFPDYNGIITEQLGGVESILFIGSISSTDLFGGYFGNSVFINNQSTRNYSPLNKYKITAGLKTNSLKTFSNFIIGRDRNNIGREWNGEIAEIIAYNSVITTLERQKVEKYLMDKYAPPVNLGPDQFFGNNYCKPVLNSGNFYVSYLWSTNDTVNSITVENSGIFWVQVTDIFGRQSADTILIDISRPSFNQLNSSIICSFDSILWDSQLDKLSFSFEWSDSSTDSLIDITQPGQYFVQITDSLGCIFNSDTINITVDPIQQQISLGPDTSLCQGNEIKLTQGASQVQSYLWIDNSAASSLEINTAGQYWVEVTSQNGCTASDTINVAIQGIAPEALFSFNSVCLGDSMHFVDASVPPSGESIVEWEWDFADGNSSLDKDPVHLFNFPGVYNVKLVATTSAGCKDEYMQNVTVHHLPAIGFNTPLACSGAVIQFTDTSTVVNNSITQWSWNFGNAPSGVNNFSNLQHPSHDYTFPGTYNVKVIATTASGCIDSIIKPLIINESPISDFNAQPVCFGLPVEFINNSSITSPLTISSYNWTFANNTSTNIEPTFLFSSAGLHTVSLVVAANNGCASEIQKAVEVYHKPTAWFSPTDVCVGSVTEFKDLSIIGDSSINSWNWNFNDVDSFSIQNPVINFNEQDVYFVSLKVNTLNGCADSVIRIVKIHPLPIPLFTIEPQVVVPGYPMFLNNLSNGSQVYIWDLGDGTSSYLSEPQHTYTSEGTYQIILNAESQFGCKKSFSRTLNVITANLDIAVTNVFVKNYDNYLNITAELTNYGTVAVNEIEMILEQKNGRRIKELWTGDFHSGKKLLYEFNAEITPLEVNIQDYVCISALNPNKSIDSNADNNEFCKLLGNNDLVLMEPFPNPVTNQMTIRFFLPNSEDIKLEIISHDGKLISNNFIAKGVKGINTVPFDAAFLNSGMYAVKLSFGGQVFIRRFIKGVY